MAKYSLILASGSPRRREILKMQDIKFEIKKSTCEEIITQTDPEKVVLELSRQKALDVAAMLDKESCEENILILAADTVVAYDGKILGKPEDEADAKRMLQMLSGKKHQVYTGVTLYSPGDMPKIDTGFFECTNVEFYPLDETEIDRYIKSKDPMDKAGSYGIQGPFSIYVKGIEGDYNNVVGLPMAALYHKLKELSIEL